MSDLNNAHQSHIRISDAERARAIEALGSHFAEGRLKLDEYEQRASAATEATTHHELDTLFQDLPPLKKNSALMPMYSAAEVQRVNNTGKKTKAGLLALTAIGSTAIAIAAHAPLVLFLIPAVAVMLYMLKLGPAEWHSPSQRKLDRQRLRAIKAEQALQQSQRRAIRREMTDELTQSALRFAHNKIKRY